MPRSRTTSVEFDLNRSSTEVGSHREVCKRCRGQDHNGYIMEEASTSRTLSWKFRDRHDVRCGIETILLTANDQMIIAKKLTSMIANTVHNQSVAPEVIFWLALGGF